MPAPALNGYALTNHFRKLRLRENFSPLEAYLFFELVAICNDEGWAVEFSASNGVLQAALGCSEQGLINARLRLAKAGLLSFISGNRRTPTSYRFLVQGSTELNHTAAKGSTQSSTQLSHSEPEGSTELSHETPKTPDGSSQGSSKGSTELSPYKEQTKTKIKSAQSGKKGASQNELSFEQFWNAYGKKTGRFKSAQKWADLSADEQAAALEHAPRFAAATPEKQYRKDPLTYLNGKCWLDEELPAPRHGQPVAPAPVLTSEPAPAPELNADFLAQQQARAEAEQEAHFAKYAAV